MKLYIWSGDKIENHWRQGIIFAMANSAEEARQAVIDSIGDVYPRDYEEETLREAMEKEPDEFDNVHGGYLYEEW